MIEVFPLEIDLCATQHAAPALRVIKRRRSADKSAQVVIQFGDELPILDVALIGLSQFLDRTHQGFGDKPPAVGSEVTTFIRHFCDIHLLCLI